MNRRSFLASVAAALVLDPERALWVPGRKLISVPKALWVPDCEYCRSNVITLRAADLVRRASGLDAGHLFPADQERSSQRFEEQKREFMAMYAALQSSRAEAARGASAEAT